MFYALELSRILVEKLRDSSRLLLLLLPYANRSSVLRP
jgi:hypothetical protein